MGNQGISVIIPTAGATARRESLHQAIESIITQAEVDARALVVLNGNQFDEKVLEYLRARQDIDLHRQDEASLPQARILGRRSVKTPFFGFLDDDDLLLPGALSERLAVMLRDQDTAVVATNGVYRDTRGDRPLMENFPEPESDPIQEIFRQNWLASSGALFRTDAIDESFFDPEQRYFEWTMTAYRLGLAKKKVHFLDRNHVVIHDTPDSLSKELSYFEEHPRIWQRLLSEGSSSDIRRGLREKLSRSHHELASTYFRAGRKKDAWIEHMKSMRCFYGLRYLPYTRHLMFKSKEQYKKFREPTSA